MQQHYVFAVLRFTQLLDYRGIFTPAGERSEVFPRQFVVIWQVDLPDGCDRRQLHTGVERVERCAVLLHPVAVESDRVGEGRAC